MFGSVRFQVASSLLQLSRRQALADPAVCKLGVLSLDG